MWGQYIHCHMNTRACMCEREERWKNHLQNIARVLISAHFVYCSAVAADASNWLQFQAFVFIVIMIIVFLDMRKRDSYDAKGEMKEKETEIRIVASKGKHM